jgi:hypothetical protein
LLSEKEENCWSLIQINTHSKIRGRGVSSRPRNPDNAHDHAYAQARKKEKEKKSKARKIVKIAESPVSTCAGVCDFFLSQPVGNLAVIKGAGVFLRPHLERRA